MVVLPRILYALAFVCFTQASLSWAYDTEKSAIQLFVNKISPGDLVATAKVMENNQYQYVINLFREGKIINSIQLSDLGFTDFSFTSISGLGVSLNGTVFIWGNESQSWRIVAITSDGKVSSFTPPVAGSPSVYISPKGTAYVPITANDIAIITSEGMNIKNLGFEHTNKIGMNSVGALYVLGKKLQQNVLSITMVTSNRQESTKTLEGLHTINGMEENPDGTLYVWGIIGPQRQEGIVVITPDGDVSKAKSFGLESLESSIKMGSNGTIYVIGLNKANNHSIVMITPDGSVSEAKPLGVMGSDLGIMNNGMGFVLGRSQQKPYHQSIVTITPEGELSEPKILPLDGMTFAGATDNGTYYLIGKNEAHRGIIVMITPDGKVLDPITLELQEVLGTRVDQRNNAIYAWSREQVLIIKDGIVSKYKSFRDLGDMDSHHNNFYHTPISSNGTLYLTWISEQWDKSGVIRLTPEGYASFFRIYSPSRDIRMGADGVIPPKIKGSKSRIIKSYAA